MKIAEGKSSPYHLETIENPTKAQIDPFGLRLREYNFSKVGVYKREEFAVCAYLSDGTLIGGMYGYLVWGWMYLDIAWVDEALRHHGIGTLLLSACEKYAVEHGIRNFRTNTGSFQSPSFYKKNGYEIFAQLPVKGPDGSDHIDYFMKKQI